MNTQPFNFEEKIEQRFLQPCQKQHLPTQNKIKNEINQMLDPLFKQFIQNNFNGIVPRLEDFENISKVRRDSSADSNSPSNRDKDSTMMLNEIYNEIQQTLKKYNSLMNTEDKKSKIKTPPKIKQQLTSFEDSGSKNLQKGCPQGRNSITFSKIANLDAENLYQQRKQQVAQNLGKAKQSRDQLLKQTKKQQIMLNRYAKDEPKPIVNSNPNVNPNVNSNVNLYVNPNVNPKTRQKNQTLEQKQKQQFQQFFVKEDIKIQKSNQNYQNRSPEKFSYQNRSPEKFSSQHSIVQMKASSSHQNSIEQSPYIDLSNSSYRSRQKNTLQSIELSNRNNQNKFQNSLIRRSQQQTLTISTPVVVLRKSPSLNGQSSPPKQSNLRRSPSQYNHLQNSPKGNENQICSRPAYFDEILENEQQNQSNNTLLKGLRNLSQQKPFSTHDLWKEKSTSVKIQPQQQTVKIQTQHQPVKIQLQPQQPKPQPKVIREDIPDILYIMKNLSNINLERDNQSGSTTSREQMLERIAAMDPQAIYKLYSKQ